MQGWTGTVHRPLKLELIVTANLNGLLYSL